MVNQTSEIRHRIREHMIDSNLTYSQLAEITGISENTLQPWVRKGKGGNIENYVKCADGLNVTVDSLIIRDKPLYHKIDTSESMLEYTNNSQTSFNEDEDEIITNLEALNPSKERDEVLNIYRNKNNRFNQLSALFLETGAEGVNLIPCDVINEYVMLCQQKEKINSLNALISVYSNYHSINTALSRFALHCSKYGLEDQKKRILEIMKNSKKD